MVILCTNRPEYRNDVAEEIRLFLGLSEIGLQSEDTSSVGGDAFTANLTLLLSWGLRCFDYSQMVIQMKSAKTTAVFVYEYIFGNARSGIGQAGAVILTLVLVLSTTIVTTVLRKREVEL